MAFLKNVDMRNRWEMQKFLLEHFRYNTANSWNYSTSYACNMKIYNLDVSGEVKSRLYEMLNCNEVYERIGCLINTFDVEHDFRWQAAFNGRSGGYLVLYQGGKRSSEYKSFCRFCGQGNYTSTKQTGDVCGRCHKPRRVDYVCPVTEVFTYSCRATDMDEDFEEWSMEELRERVKLIQEFDKLADNIVAEVKYMAECYEVAEEEYYVRKKRKVLKEEVV